MSFYEQDYTCLCTTDRRADCFESESDIISSCEGENFCENEGPCSFGSRCQFSAKGKGLSLDVILGYHIQVKVPLSLTNVTRLFISIALITLLLATSLLVRVTIESIRTVGALVSPSTLSRP